MRIAKKNWNTWISHLKDNRQRYETKQKSQRIWISHWNISYPKKKKIIFMNSSSSVFCRNKKNSRNEIQKSLSHKRIFQESNGKFFQKNFIQFSFLWSFICASFFSLVFFWLLNLFFFLTFYRHNNNVMMIFFAFQNLTINLVDFLCSECKSVWAYCLLKHVHFFLIGCFFFALNFIDLLIFIRFFFSCCCRCRLSIIHLIIRSWAREREWVSEWKFKLFSTSINPKAYGFWAYSNKQTNEIEAE